MPLAFAGDDATKALLDLAEENLRALEWFSGYLNLCPRFVSGEELPDVLAKDVLLKFIKSRGVLVTVTLIYCYIVNFLTAGGQTVAIIVTEQTFEDAFDRMGIHRRVLSRTLEDAGTLSAPIVPWGVATLYVMEVLGCGTEYIPYCWFIFIVPIFSILCAFSGFGIWDKDGNKMWGRKKAAAK